MCHSTAQDEEESGYDTFSPGGHMGLGFKPTSGESSEDEDDASDSSQCNLLEDLEARLAGFVEANQFLADGLLDEAEVLEIKVCGSPSRHKKQTTSIASSQSRSNRTNADRILSMPNPQVVRIRRIARRRRPHRR